MKQIYLQEKARGFTLIELLVASSLAIIVIIAASSTYLMTRNLNKSAQKRIDVQNNIRNSAALISRDARMAGGFGCFNTGGVFTGGVETSKPSNDGDFPDLALASPNLKNNTNFRLKNNQTDGYGVIWTNSIAGITLPAGARMVGNALVFVYGEGNTGITNITTSLNQVTLINNNNQAIADTIKAKGPLVLSSCTDAYLVQANAINNSNVLSFKTAIAGKNKAQLTQSTTNMSSLSISKLYAAAYLIANMNGQNKLLRYELADNGNWQTNPQVLADNISAMNVSFAYEHNCKKDDEFPVNQSSYTASNSLSYTNLPALIQIQLTYSGSTQTNYIINASVRGGSNCSTISNGKKA